MGNARSGNFPVQAKEGAMLCGKLLLEQESSLYKQQMMRACCQVVGK